MRKTTILMLFALLAFVSIEGKKITRGRSSGTSRGSSKKTSYNPQPTSLSQPQPASAPKPSLFAWQEKPAARSPPKTNTQSHSYPSSQTGMSGNSQAKQPSQNVAAQPANNQPSHSYPASNGMSGSSGSSGGYPSQQGSGLSGAGAAAPPPYSGGGYPSNNYGGSNHQQGPPPAYNAGTGAGYPKQVNGLSGSGAAAPPPYSGGHYPANNNGGNYHHPPPTYNNGGYGGPGSYHPQNTPQMPGYFGNNGAGGYGSFGGVSRSRSALTGVGIAGAGVGTLLTGLALWNLARSTGRSHHTVIYDNRGQPVAVAPDNNAPAEADSILGDLVNCTLTISNDNSTEVLAIPCAIATSFTPEADVKDSGNKGASDNTKCTVTVVTKAGKEFMTTIPCSILLNSAAENNVTEPPLLVNGTEIGTTILPPSDVINPIQPSHLRIDTSVDIKNSNLNCTAEPGDERDPINPCFAVTNNLTVIPLESSDADSSLILTTPGSA